MLKLVRFAPLLSGLAMLTACFVSDVPLIREGAQIHDGPVAFCMSDDDACELAQPFEDGYLTSDANGETQVRFKPLGEAGGAAVWLGEAELGDADERAWFYVVARPESRSADGTVNFRIVMPDCDLASEDALTRFGFTQVDPYTCLASDIDSLSAYLLEQHGDDFADPDWWRDQD